MLSSKKMERDLMVEDDGISSRLALLNDQENNYFKNDMKDNLMARLSQNFNQLQDLLRERRELLLGKVKNLFREENDRIEAISRGRMQDLKNEARLLKDDAISSLVENSQRMNNTKMLLRKIVQQYNFSQFQTMEKAKGKKFFDRSREVQSDLSNKNKKFNLILEEIEKLNENERQMYKKMQERREDMSSILKRRQRDYIRKAEGIESELQKYKAIIADNKATKDKKKKDLELVLGTIMDTIVSHQNLTVSRIADLEDLFGGNENSQDFERFIKLFQNIIDNKFEEKKDMRKEAAVQSLIKMAQGYDAYIEEIQKQRSTEVTLLEDINQGVRRKVKMALIQKIYFQEISKDRARLTEILKKCKSYKGLIDTFDGERMRLDKELGRLNQLKNSFGPRWKALASQEARKQELRKQLTQLQYKQAQLQKLQRKSKQSEYSNSNFQLTRQILQRELDDLATKSNITEYKARLKELERLEKQYQNQDNLVFIDEYQRLKQNISDELHSLNARYADIIADIFTEGEFMDPLSFISRLSLRLALF